MTDQTQLDPALPPERPPVDTTEIAGETGVLRSLTPSPTYTRTGDDGTSVLGDRSITRKSDARLRAYGDCEEANSAIGLTVARATPLPEQVVTTLIGIQNDLVDLTADLSTPIGADPDPTPRVDDRYVQRLERACDHFDTELPPLSGFILPGGTSAAAFLHHARAIVRRAERSTVIALGEFPDSVNPAAVRYLNRLASLLWILARVGNQEHGDTPWVAGHSVRAGQVELWEPRPAS